MLILDANGVPATRWLFHSLLRIWTGRIIKKNNFHDCRYERNFRQTKEYTIVMLCCIVSWFKPWRQYNMQSASFEWLIVALAFPYLPYGVDCHSHTVLLRGHGALAV